MASHSPSKAVVLLAGGTVVKGHAVKIGADDNHVIECTANTDLALGIALNSATVGVEVEIALPGGGAKAKLGEASVAGKLLVPHTDGTCVKANAAGDRLVGITMEGGASGDLVDVEVLLGHAAAAES